MIRRKIKYCVVGATSIIGMKLYYDITWKPVSKDEVIWAWLNAEATDKNHQFAKGYDRNIQKFGPIVLDHPKFHNKEENEKREQVFMEVRGKYDLWKPIVDSTTWYKRRMLLFDSQIYGPFPPSGPKRPIYNLNNIMGT